MTYKTLHTLWVWRLVREEVRGCEALKFIPLPRTQMQRCFWIGNTRSGFYFHLGTQLIPDNLWDVFFNFEIKDFKTEIILSVIIYGKGWGLEGLGARRYVSSTELILFGFLKID